jgi:hypothetical protein
MVIARVYLDDFTNKVLNVIKAQFGLKDKSDAINKFCKMFGDQFVETEINEEYIKKLLDIENEHMKKHKKRRMSVDELNKLCEAN